MKTLTAGVLSALLLFSGITSAQAQSGFVQRTHVMAPKQSGTLQLLESRFDPNNKGAGVSFRYTDPALIDRYIDFYIYPAGRGLSAQMLSDGMEDFRTSLQQAEQAGLFSQLQIIEDSEFALLPSTTRRTQGGGKGPSDENPAVREAFESSDAKAQRLLMQMRDANGALLNSLGYLAYKDMYFFKLRITVPDAVMDTQDLIRLGDNTMRQLTDNSEALNIGSCGTADVYLDDSLSQEQRSVELFRQLSAYVAGNCELRISRRDLQKRQDGRERVDISFTARDWTNHDPRP